MIQIKNLTKKYGSLMVFNHADFTFPNHGLVCLLGVSGSGKTTLLNLLAGFDRDYSGEIIMNGQSLRTCDAKALCDYRSMYIGFIFQDYHLLQGYTVLENILLSSELRGVKFRDDFNKAVKLLDRCNLPQMQNKKVENLSGGQKQRVAIARALINNPCIVLADEPTGSLDRKNATEIMSMLKEIAEEKLVIVITHDKKICTYADEIISLENGKIVCSTMKNEEQQVDETKPMITESTNKIATWKRALKNVHIHFNRYVWISLAISLGVFCFILSLTFGTIMNQSIQDFKEKNTAFNNGYVKMENKNSDEIFVTI